MRDLADSPRWRGRLQGLLRDALAVAEPDTYLDLLTAHGLQADVWQTQYLHVLRGDDPVLEWVRGTGLRPLLQRLNDDEAGAFSAEYAALLRHAYPRRPYGTVFPFLRTFAVAQKAGAPPGSASSPPAHLPLAEPPAAGGPGRSQPAAPATRAAAAHGAER